MAAEALAHGGDDLLGISMALARTEARVERRRQNLGRHRFLDSRLDRPPTLAGILDIAGIRIEPALMRQGARRQIEQPGGDDAAAPPDFRNVGEIEGETMFGLERLGVRVAQDVEAFGIGLHHAVFDTVVDHLDEMAGAAGSGVQIARFDARIAPFAVRRLRNFAASRRQRTENGIETTHDGRVEGMEFVLPDWFYRGVIDRSLVLAIDPAYFRLTGGIERWLYRVARKHAGRQPKGWLFEIPHLHEKSGSLVRVSDFALQIRRIAARQPLPGYRLRIEWQGRRELLRILPAHLSTVPVDGAVETLGTSHANGIGISHATPSGLRTHEPQLTLWPETAIPGLNLESNSESNSCSGPARSADKCQFSQKRGLGPINE